MTGSDNKNKIQLLGPPTSQAQVPLHQMGGMLSFGFSARRSMVARSSAVLLLCILSQSQAFLSSFPTSSRIVWSSHRRNDRFAKDWLSSLEAKTYTTKDFGVDWNRPNAQGSFGKVYFSSQGFAGMGGQVVIKCPIKTNLGLAQFATEQAVNAKLANAYPKGRWAQYLGDLTADPSKPLPSDLGQVGIVFKKEAGVSLEEMLITKQNVAGKLGCKSEASIRPELCTKVMKELLQACVQMHEVGVMHRDIKPENVLVVGGSEPLKLIDFGSACDVQTKQGINDISLDPWYAPPEQRINPQQPGKFDVYSVAMTGMRCLLPSLSKDPRPGVDHRNPNSVTLNGMFAEVDLPRAGHVLEKWQQSVLRAGDPNLQQEVAELFGGGHQPLLALLQDMLSRSPAQRPDARTALSRL